MTSMVGSSCCREALRALTPLAQQAGPRAARCDLGRWATLMTSSGLGNSRTVSARSRSRAAGARPPSTDRSRGASDIPATMTPAAWRRPAGASAGAAGPPGASQVSHADAAEKRMEQSAVLVADVRQRAGACQAAAGAVVDGDAWAETGPVGQITTRLMVWVTKQLRLGTDKRPKT